MNHKRLNKLKESIYKNKIDAFLISSPFNLRYIFNFKDKGCLALVSDSGKVKFVCSPIYYQEALFCPDLKDKDIEILMQDEFFRYINSSGIKRIGFESTNTSIFHLKKLKSKLKGISLIPFDNLIEQIRAVKDEKEIQLIKKASRIADKTYHFIKHNIKPGFREVDVVNKIENFVRLKEAEKTSFNPVVATGEYTAFPHHIATVRRFVKSDIVILDLGCVYKGYCSDLTRTFLLGKDKNEKHKRLKNGMIINYSKVYDTVLKAQNEAIKVIKPGTKCSKIDYVARGVIKEAGFGEFFMHNTGHGVGLQIHEIPYLKARSEHVLGANMVITVEPGVYIPGWGGVRIEDMVLVTRNGYEILTKSSK